MKQNLTADRFDSTFVAPTPRIIWTASAIGRRIGVSADFVRDVLAKESDTPVRRVGGRYCTIEADLIAFFKQK